MNKKKFALALYNEALSEEMTEFNEQILAYNIHDNVKDVEGIHSGGGNFHLCIHLHDGHIMSLHYAFGDIEMSYAPWDSIASYFQHEWDGFGFEYEKPNYENRVTTFRNFHTIINNYINVY